YNLPVTASAKPAFPVEYLLVSLTQSFPLAPAPAFRSDTPFAIENREHVHAVQSLGALKRHLAPALGSSERLSVLLADFHLLVYLFGLGILGEHEVALIGRIVCEPMEAAQLAEELMAAGGWQTLVLMLQEASDSDLDAQHSAAGSDAAAAANPAPPAPPSATWACRHCTFENAAANASCEMCALPRD
ncbi:nuclear protein localization protein 4, partial [Coemansia sp. RSA 2702]